jgi:hypothetical protein
MNQQENAAIYAHASWSTVTGVQNLKTKTMFLAATLLIGAAGAQADGTSMILLSSGMGSSYYNNPCQDDGVTPFIGGRRIASQAMPGGRENTIEQIVARDEAAGVTCVIAASHPRRSLRMECIGAVPDKEVLYSDVVPMGADAKVILSRRVDPRNRVATYVAHLPAVSSCATEDSWAVSVVPLVTVTPKTDPLTVTVIPLSEEGATNAPAPGQ